MTKYQEWKDRMVNPPPERLAAIEYKSHFLNIAGVFFVSAILIWKSYWFIIFAFIFGVGVSYSQGMTAYMKYKMIKSLTQENPNLEEEKSPTRRRANIVRSVFGKYMSWIVSFLSILIMTLLFNPFTLHWYQVIVFFMGVIFIYIFLLIFVFYWIANPIYRRRKHKKEVTKK